MTESEIRTAAVDFQDMLDAGELLTGTPTVAEYSGDAALTIGTVSLNSTSLTIDGRTVAANKAVRFSVSTGTAGQTYRLKVTCATNGSPAQTLIRFVDLVVVADM
jgi:hypothetical protein